MSRHRAGMCRLVTASTDRQRSRKSSHLFRPWYRVAEGPEVESDHYNFTRPQHPARSPAGTWQDTFLSVLSRPCCARTPHAVSRIRHLGEHAPPVRDRGSRQGHSGAMRWMPTHSPWFNQPRVEGVGIDEGLDFSICSAPGHPFFCSSSSGICRWRFRPATSPS